MTQTFQLYIFNPVSPGWGGTSAIFIRVRADLVLKPNPVQKFS